MIIIKKSYSDITVVDIITFEQTFSVKLPMAYRNFLLEHNGGVPDKIYFLKNGADVVLNEFLPLKYSNLSVENYLNDFHFNHQNFIPIAEDAFGNLILLKCNTEKGIIYFWNHESTSVKHVTDSFEYFVENLQKNID